MILPAPMSSLLSATAIETGDSQQDTMTADAQDPDLQPDPDDPALVRLSRSARRRLSRQMALPTWGETPAQSQTRRTQLIKNTALSLGFSRVGIAEVCDLPADAAALRRWVDAGMHGEMAWMAEDVARRSDPRLVVPGARSVIVLALDYDSAEPRTRQVDLHGDGSPEQRRGWVSRYAWGDDYHLVIEKLLRQLEVQVTSALAAELDEDFRGPGQKPGPFRSVRDFRWYVDHGPVLERAWAERAGLGWRGKHTLLISPQHGSYFFLACIVTSVALDPDPPQTDHCGTCTACLDACPTSAIVRPHVVDARLCISHASIEVDGHLAPQDRNLLGDMLFGCDICQDVCPWNRFSKPSGNPAFAPRDGLVAPRLADILAMQEHEFAQTMARSPLKRRTLAGLQDNASAVLEGRQNRKPKP